MERRNRSNSPEEIARGSERTRERMETVRGSRSPEITNPKRSKGKKKIKLLREKPPSRTIMSGKRKQRIAKAEFDVMVAHLKAESGLVLERVNEKNQTASEGDEQPARWRNDQKTYQQNYYKRNLKQPYTSNCCGRATSSKSNLSKPKKRNVCNRKKTVPL